MRAIIGIAAVVALALGLIYWLVVIVGVDEPLAPSPERVVQTFIINLGTHPERALRVLDTSLRLHTTPSDLQETARLLNQKYPECKFIPGGSLLHFSGGVRYLALLRSATGRVLHPEFILQRDHRTGLWHITSFSGLSALVAPRPRFAPVKDDLVPV